MSEEDLENVLKRHTQDISKSVQADGKQHYSCYVDGEEEYDALITDLSAVGFSFYTRSAKASESSRALFSYAKKEGDLQIPFFGSPFQILKSSYMYCSMDGNYKPTTRPTTSADKVKKFRYSAQPTKKLGCQAIMRVKCVRIFTDDCYKLTSPYKRHCRTKNKILSQLAADLLSPTLPSIIIRFMIIVSAAEEHNHSIESTNQNQRLHPRLKEEIYNLVRTIPNSTTKTVKAQLKVVVKEMFEGRTDIHPPNLDNRCYYPIDHVIRFHIYQAHAAVDRGGFDQDALAIKVREWIRAYPEDDFFFRPRVSNGTGGRRGASADHGGTNLLFCHQTKFQRHLLKRYGNEICLLDAAYKTLKYNFPLYFLMARTNTGDFVVGTMVVQRENTDSLSEAIAHFVKWNPHWDPKYLLSGNSEYETEALKRMFPRAAVYMSLYHRERDWDRWLDKKTNILRRWVATMRSAWHAIAAARSELEYAQNVQAMYELEAYRDCPSAQAYFYSSWLPLHRSWVQAFQHQDFVTRFNINNGVENQRASLEHAHLVSSPEKTLSGVVGVVVETMLADQLERYSLGNIPLDHREYTETVPEFLRDRPIPFIESVMLRYEEACDYNASLMNDMGEGLFVVKAEPNSEDWCSVDFLEMNCSCVDFTSWRVPCIHMCAVFIFVEGWGFDRLPNWYRDHPFVTVDEDFSGQIGVKIDFEGEEAEEEEEEEPESEEIQVEMDIGEDGEMVETSIEETDVEMLMENTREKLLALLGYTYLEHDAHDALRIANSVMALDEVISTTEVCEEMEMPVDMEKEVGLAAMIKTEDVNEMAKRIKLEPVRSPPVAVKPRPQRRVFPKLKIAQKNVGRCDVPVHQWREYITEKTDVYPPQAVDQIVVIDVNHRQELA